MNQGDLGPMELIRQRHKNDCGIACAAMLAGVSYEEASDAAAPYGKRRGRTAETTMYLILRNLGLKVRLPMIAGPANGSNALLKCNCSTRRIAGVKRWHWCVWSAAEQKILDPSGDGKVRPVLSHMPATPRNSAPSLR
jgi:ABC-type bacteriocin/lantibiotic exporter with double-glycine peptidase domain